MSWLVSLQEMPSLMSTSHLIRAICQLMVSWLMLFLHSDWFRLETLDDSLQPTIDMLLNLAIFIW